MMKELLKQTALRHSERIAYIVGDESITYGELRRRAEESAELLKREGSAPVIIFGGKEISMLVSLLACLISGRTYIPVDRFMPEARIEQIIESSGASLLLSEYDADFHGITCCSLDGLERFRNSPPMPQNSDIAYIIFTSGTTGEPKGVPISLSNLENFVDWLNQLEPLCGYRDITVLNQASFSFDLSVADLFYSLTNGHTLAALETSDTTEIYTVIGRNQVNVCVVTPTFMKLCLLDPLFCAENFPSLKCVYFCGETLEPKTVRKLWERFPTLEIINAYGPTEATSAVTAVRILRDMLDSPLLPVGQAEHYAAEIEIDDDEIVLKGKSVFGGYLNGAAGGYYSENGVNCYRTGDLGYIENGFLYCRGRKDSQIKYKGYRIELSDIERNIGRISGVQDCAAAAVRSSDGTVKHIAAYIVGTVDAEEIRRTLKTMLPAYMIPKTIRFLEKLPVNANGKTDRKVLCND